MRGPASPASSISPVTSPSSASASTFDLPSFSLLRHGNAILVPPTTRAPQSFRSGTAFGARAAEWGTLEQDAPLELRALRRTALQRKPDSQAAGVPRLQGSAY